MDDNSTIASGNECALGWGPKNRSRFYFDGFDERIDFLTLNKKGYIFPLIDETNMPLVVRCILYFVGLIWSFLGVAIVADIFMCAIEGKRVKPSFCVTQCAWDWKFLSFSVENT